ncbi:hypothetical protein MMC17_006059 [Xylographa soralifera]|nr:hypothetical protein [Xylographa soralifera]
MHFTWGLLAAWISLQFCTGYLQEILTLDDGLFTVFSETVVQYPSTTHWYVVKAATTTSIVSGPPLTHVTSTITTVTNLTSGLSQSTLLPTTTITLPVTTASDGLPASLNASTIIFETSSPIRTTLVSSSAPISVDYVTVVTVETINKPSTTLPTSTSTFITTPSLAVVTTQSTTPTPSNIPPSTGPSVGAEVGIGVGVSLGTIALLGSCFFVYRRARQAKRTAEISQSQQGTVRGENPELMAEEMKHELHGSGGRHEMSVQERAQELRGERNAHELEA